MPRRECATPVRPRTTNPPPASSGEVAWPRRWKVASGGRSSRSEGPSDRMEGCGSAGNDATGLDSRCDPPNANRSQSTQMEFWRGTGGIRVPEQQSLHRLATRALARHRILHPRWRRETASTPRTIPENCYRESRIGFWRGTGRSSAESASFPARPASTFRCAHSRLSGACYLQILPVGW